METWADVLCAPQVKQQRSRKRNGKLNPAFIQRLNSIGFVWQLQGGEAADKDREREGDASTASAGNHLANGGGDTGRAKAQPKGEDSDCVTQSAGSHKQPPDSEEQGDMDAERVHAMVKSLKRTADALSSIAGQACPTA